MRIRSAWGKVVTFLGGATLICGVLQLAISGGSGRRTLTVNTERAATAAKERASSGIATRNQAWAETYDKLPLSFEANEGQTAPEVRYVSHGSGYELFLTPQEAVIVLQQSVPWNLSTLYRAAYFRALRQARQAGTTTVLRMGLEGANLETRISGIDPLPGKVNYFIGNVAERWRTDIPTYARVKYAQVYPGVDLVFYGNQKNLEYDFVVAPGADPKTIALTLRGARNIRVNAAGDVILRVAGGEVVLEKPVIYQIANGRRKRIDGGYSLTGKQRLSFSVSNYDRSEPLIIDPVLNYSTYLGGSVTGDTGLSIAVDSQGDAFVTGTTFSTTFPTKNGFGAGNANGVAFVTELNPSGTALLYSTYLGGTGGDMGLGIALDPTGNIYVVGITFSSNFPTTTNGLKSGTNSGATSGTSFVSKINPAVSGSASLVYSSYLGGISGPGIPDFANAVAADANGNAYVTGFTRSSPGSGLGNFPITSSAFQTTLSSTAGNAFLTKIDTTKSGTSSLIYSTYLGGNGADATSSGQGFGEIAFGVALDSSNKAYIAGTTTSTNFPTTSTAFQPNTSPPGAVAGGTAFISKFDTTLSGTNSLAYSTYLGGNVSELGTVIAVKPSSTIAYVTGTTRSPAFPTFPANAFQTAAATTFPVAFVSLVDTGQPAGTALVYSTFLGGNSTTGFAIQADASGNAYVGGGTASPSFPVTAGAFQGAFVTGASGEGFVSKLKPGGNGAADLLYSTLFGGRGSTTNSTNKDGINAIAIDGSNNAYITGLTFSSAASFPVFPAASASPPAFQTSLPSGATSAAFLAKLTLIPTLGVSPSSLDFGSQPKGVTSTPKTVTLTNNTSDPIPFASSNLAFKGSNAADFASPSNTCGTSIAAGATCMVNVTFTPSVTGAESATLVITVMITDGGLTSSQSFNVSLSGSGAPPDFTLSATPNTLTVKRGDVGTATISVNPTGGFNGAVALTCTGAPVNSSCMLNPTSITPPTTSTMTFTAHAMLVPLPISKPAPPLSLLRLVPLFVALMLLFLLLSKQRLRTRLAMASAILICIALAACSSGPKKPAPGTYPLTITGTSGSLSRSTTVTVTVN